MAVSAPFVMPSIDAIPTPKEIEKQLERMLGCQLMGSRPQQAKVLECIVRGSLANHEITEKYLREKLFPYPPYKSESNIARRTVDLVRSLLGQYYADTGRDDLVVITLPQSPSGQRIKFATGQAYAPRFRYNAAHVVAQKYRMGLHHLQWKSPNTLIEAVWNFTELLDLSPDHVGANIGMAEAMCLLSLVNYYSEKPIATAHYYADKAVELAGDLWHSHAAVGAATLVEGKLYHAALAFDKAINLDRACSLKYSWYHAFLLAAGRTTEALDLVKSSVDERPDDAFASATYGIYLYALRHFDDARRAFGSALGLDYGCWLAHLGLALVHLACSEGDEAFLQVQYMQMALNDMLWPLPGLTILCGMRAKTVSKELVDVVCRRAHEDIKTIEGAARVPWVQVALAAMAEDKPDRAFEALRKAWLDFDALMVWLDVLPLFDPLRDHPRFPGLMRGLNFLLNKPENPLSPV